MELRHLEHFVAVAEEQHFTRAAERLHIAQSGLSASVRALEREMGVDLFTRSTRRVQLTDAGRILLTEARRTLAAAARAREAVAAMRGLLTGRLTVGTEQCLGVTDPVGLLADFRVRHPGVQVHMDQAGSGRLLEQVRTGSMDLAFVSSDTPPEGVRLLPMAAEPMVLLCRADHALADHARVDPGRAGEVPVPLEWSRLDGHTFVDFHPDWGARQAVDGAFAAAGVRRVVAMQVGDVHTLLDLVTRGMGAAVVPLPVTHKEQAKGLCRIPLAGDALWRVWVAMPATGRPSPAAAALLADLTDAEAPRAGDAEPEETAEPAVARR
ncbi:LysR family transcriptional regulator [Allostreptomyces psammosilenae]|uniref:DNA-binding transcriptional LysR family regulator n=1 Tax=Allostreptomyces psammosilenae TaxID=1892865 RepID=A0A853ACR4_9ACTN|nr:LysR family transcriptional regulator [Allostreptomyces psammosilenae]NYI08238.1 DNA-binding transcriptional LysR family regulator [Allostreptomyces psammosilenae]